MRRMRGRGAAAMVTAVALVLGACSSDSALEPGAGLSASRGAQGAPSGVDEPRAGMEINYMEFTIDHHAMGVMMAQMCLEKAVHEELRELCRVNLETQSAQIQQLQAWLQEWYGISYQPQLTPGDMRMMDKLAELSGAAFEIEFMETFSRHHHQIVQRSEPIVKETVHEPLRQMAASIIAMQTEDIRRMLTWLCQWYGICHPRFGLAPAT
jgi:uncharacterized protein (DUF305 family)